MRAPRALLHRGAGRRQPERPSPAERRPGRSVPVALACGAAGRATTRRRCLRSVGAAANLHAMSVAITIRDVPDEVRDELGRCELARAGKSLQEYLRGMLMDKRRPATRRRRDRARAGAREHDRRARRRRIDPRRPRRLTGGERSRRVRRVGARGAPARLGSGRALGGRRALRRRHRRAGAPELRVREHPPPARARGPGQLRPSRAGPCRHARSGDRALALRAARREDLGASRQPVELRRRLRRAGRAHRAPRSSRSIGASAAHRACAARSRRLQPSSIGTGVAAAHSRCSDQTASSFPAGSAKWKRRPPGNE